jgi:hypothetical protein
MNVPIVDMHVHIQPWDMLKPEVRAVLTAHRRPEELALLQDVLRNPQALLRWMDAQGIQAMALINYSSPDVMGFTDDVNDFVTKFCAVAPDRLIAVGSLHPRLTPNPADFIRTWIDRGLRAFKLHPPHQLVYPNDYLHGNRHLEALYAICQEAGVPVIVHTGTSIFPGARNRFGDPIHLDDVAVDFPNLRIVMAHGGRPLWMNTAFFLLRRHPNMFLDIAGIPPRSLLEYFPRLAEVADRVVFGSDWPGPGVPGIRANAEAFWALPLPESVRRQVLYENYRRLWP